MSKQFKTLSQAWESYNADVIHEHASRRQRNEVKRAFYAGAASMYSCQVTVTKGIADPGQGHPGVINLMAEALKFIESVKSNEVFNPSERVFARHHLTETLAFLTGAGDNLTSAEVEITLALCTAMFISEDLDTKVRELYEVVKKEFHDYEQGGANGTS